MNNVYKLFFKSSGGKPTLPFTTQYNYPVASIEASNFEELGKGATDIVEDLGLPLDDFGVDLKNEGKQYENAITTGKAKKYITNNTGEY